MPAKRCCVLLPQVRARRMPARPEAKRSSYGEGAGMTTPAAKWKAAERARHKEAGRVAVTVHIYPEDRELVARYIKRLNERAERRRAG